MKKLIVSWCAAAALALAQYKVEPAGAPPADLAVSSALASEGARIVKADGSVLAELWLVKQLPGGGKAEENASFATIPHGSLLGVIRVPGRHSDRRGQTIKAGAYTMRYSVFPLNGDHQGVAPQRDFLLLSPASSDTNASATPGFDALMDMSRKASGTPHPLVLSIWKPEGGAPATFAAEGEHDWVFTTRLGSTAVSIILIGRHEG
jgi:hypothetical protein